jgi:hypothetical protein
VSEERRHTDSEQLKMMTEVRDSMREMHTSFFGPEGQPDMGFINQTKVALADHSKRITRIENNDLKRVGFISGIVVLLQLGWNWLRGH